MTTQDPTIIENEVPTNNNEVPAITQGEASTITDNEEPAKSAEEVSQSSDSPELSKEKDKPQADAASKPATESYPMMRELHEQWDEMYEPLEDATDLIAEAYRQPTIKDREAKLEAARLMAKKAIERIDECVALNKRQKNLQDQLALEAFAKTLGYPNAKAMHKAIFSDSEVESEKASATDSNPVAQGEPPASAQPDPVKSTSKRDPYPNAQKVYQYLYVPDHADFTRGFTCSLRNLTGDWVKKNDDGSADMNYYRESTDTEKATMKARRDKQTAEIDAKRAARAAKKA